MRGWSWVAAGLVLASLFSGGADADIVRVMSVEDAGTVVIVDASGQAQRIVLLGVSVPTEAEAALRARQRLQALVLTRIVRLEPADGTGLSPARLWVGETEINTLLNPAPTSPNPIKSEPLPLVSEPSARPSSPAPAPALVSAPPAESIPAPVAVLEPVAPELPSPAAAPVSVANKPSGTPELAVIADRHEGVYHRPDCPGHARVSGRNRIKFASAKQAESDGFRLAGNCPPQP